MAIKTLPQKHFLIPDSAGLAFKGQIFDVYQWEQAMFDGRTKIFEMLKRPDTIQVVLVDGTKILLVDDEQPGRSVQRHFPGGRLDEGEEWLAAARRELKEETGLIVDDLRLVNCEQPVTKMEWFIPIFLATNITDKVAPQLDEGGEKISLVWEEFDVVRSQVLSGQAQMMQYLIPFFNHVKSVDQLVSLPNFQGVDIERA